MPKPAQDGLVRLIEEGYLHMHEHGSEPASAEAQERSREGHDLIRNALEQLCDLDARVVYETMSEVEAKQPRALVLLAAQAIVELRELDFCVPVEESGEA